MKGLAKLIYDSYPDSDLLPIEPPTVDEELHHFKQRLEEADGDELRRGEADTLFLFIVRELCQGYDGAASEASNAANMDRLLHRAIDDLRAVRSAIENAAYLAAQKK